jgi:hypothetical protein
MMTALRLTLLQHAPLYATQSFFLANSKHNFLARSLFTAESPSYKVFFMLHDQRWEFHPPPGASFQLHPDGIQLQFAKGREIEVERYFRQWLAVYESVARHQSQPGMHGEQWPVWPQLPPINPPQGLTQWLLNFPPFARVYMVPGMSFPGGIAVDVTRGAPGSIHIQFIHGNELAIIAYIRASLDKATGHTQSQFENLSTIVQGKRLQRGSHHLPSANITHITKNATMDDLIADARKIGDEFFANMGLALSQDTIPAEPMIDDSPMVANRGSNAAALPTCICLPSITAMGAHSEGCPAENYPPHMVPHT